MLGSATMVSTSKWIKSHAAHMAENATPITTTELTSWANAPDKFSCNSIIDLYALWTSKRSKTGNDTRHANRPTAPRSDANPLAIRDQISVIIPTVAAITDVIKAFHSGVPKTITRRVSGIRLVKANGKRGPVNRYTSWRDLG